MTRLEPVDFTFTRDWIHAGVHYHADDVAHFSPDTAHMLASLGAGENAKASRSKRRTVADADGTTTDPTGE